MKRFLIIILIISGFANMKAQDVVLMNYNTLERKFEKSNERIQHEKKKMKDKTWLKRGLLLQDIYKLDLEYIGEGTSLTEFKLYYNEPLNTVTKQENGQQVKILEYERMDYYFVNDALQRWKRKKIVTEDPLDKALKAYKKTLELDEKGKRTDDVKEQLEELKRQYMQAGINSYYNQNMDEALNDFEMVMNVNDMEMFEGVIDTLMIQYSGIIARDLGNHKKAADYYTRLAELNYGGPSVYLNIKNDYLAMGDSAMAIDIMEDAFKKYQDSINVVANLVDLYIKTDNIEQGLDKVEEAIEANPDKGELYYWKGRLLLNTEDEDRIDQALEAYEKAIETSPDLYYVYYDIGFIYFLQGQDIFSQAGMEQDVERRKEINKIATEKYEQALPNLEKALELNEANMEIKRETLDVLKRIYYKLGMTEKYNEVTRQLNNM
jgi:tetratricopeptide (TPR) repeat protein